MNTPPRPAHGWIARGLLVLGLAALALGLSACARKKPQADPLIAHFEVPAPELAAMLAQHEKEKAKGPNAFARTWVAGSFELRPERGAHKLRWLVDGQVAQAGPMRAQLEAVIGGETGPGRVLNCVHRADQAPAGNLSFQCETSPFRTEDKPKQLELGLSIAQLEAFTPTRLQADVVSVPVTLSFWDWFISAPLLGLVMLGLWWLFFKRGH